MIDQAASKIASDIAEGLEVPESAYEAAKTRYADLGEWLHDKSKAKCAHYSPEVFPQGSFRLGTVVRPLGGDDYDLDLSCVLGSGITRGTHSQKQLKEMLGDDLRDYRSERSIKEALEEKHRCWRLNYKDQLGFHMDAVPAIPQDAGGKAMLQERMVKYGSNAGLAEAATGHAVSITDNRDKDYARISDDWRVGNQEGFAKWFESRMRSAPQLLMERAIMEKVASIDELPIFKWKSPLQLCIQILKRHRDVMFKDLPDAKPISVIITTLAGHAYSGEADIPDALKAIVHGMHEHVRPTGPRVPNPVNYDEDFADKWPKDQRLERAFWSWLEQAKADVDLICDPSKRAEVAKVVKRAFDVTVSLAGTAAPAVAATPIRSTAKPWHGA